MNPALGRGLQTPLVLAAPQSNTDLGRAVDLFGPQNRLIPPHMLVSTPPPPPGTNQLLDTWSFPSRIDEPLGLVAFRLLDRLPVAARQPE
jgi:hypothetical protein